METDFISLPTGTLDDQFIANKSGGNLRLRLDAVPTVFIHRPKLKRRKATSRSMPPAVNVRNNDHTYYGTSNIGMIYAANNVSHVI